MNQQYMKPRLIRASAGTGKTYQLALEFIGLLIRFKENIAFDQIVVITFTRKATSEIRQRIIDFLHKLATDHKNCSEMIENIQNIYPDITINSETAQYLQLVYKQIITNKSRLNISTLDGFINQVFKSLIAPYYNIAEYDIDPLYNENILPKLYDVLLTDDNFHLLDNIFQTTHSRNVSSYDGFIKTILNDRWLFEFYFSQNRNDENQIAEGESALNCMSNAVERFCEKFSELVKMKYSDKPGSDIFPKAWFEELTQHTDELSPQNLIITLKRLLSDEEFIVNKSYLADQKGNFWNGAKLLKGKNNLLDKQMMTELQEDVIKFWKRYLFYRLAVPEQNAILKIAKLIFDEYDKIKFRDKVFTYSDIAFYTWKYFRNPENSVIDKHQVINLFYEQLSYRIRFILIDEFQDTSILQWNIFAPLINELIAGMGANETGTAVIVGDEKQAIYAWRSGERDLLVNLEKILEHDFSLRTLDTSYRSSYAVIEFVNRLFLNSIFKAATDSIKSNWQYNNVKVAKEITGSCHFQLSNMKRDDKKLNFSEVVEEYLLENGFLSGKNITISLKDTAILTRSRSEIEEICAVLRKHGISYIDEAGRSIIHHRTVKPLLNLLKWFTNLDLYSLVLFLRSDLILMPSKDLKLILELFHIAKRNQIPFYQQLYDKYKNIRIIQIISELHELKADPMLLLKETARKFNLINVFDQESDFVNLQKFFDIVAKFSSGNPDYPGNSAGLILFLEENELSEDFAQAEIQKQNALRIMTIHKSKGLEFDSVFLILNGNKHKPHNSGLSIYPQFDYSYAKLEECFFTWNYDKYLPATRFAPLANAKKVKEYIEDINLWYVALTRAKRNIFGLYSYSSKSNIHKYFEDFIGSNSILNVNKLMINIMLHEFSQDCVVRENYSTIYTGELEPYENQNADEEIQQKDLKDISIWYDGQNSRHLKEKDDWKLCLKPDAMQAQASSKLIGNLAHYFLQQIDFDCNLQRSTALKNTINFYGNLIPADKIIHICSQLSDFLETNKQFFDKTLWDVVYREFSVFSGNSEFRIDRLLISHKRHEIIVLDYKTGKITDPKQLENYKIIIEQIPFVKNNNYVVLPGKFLKIDLQL